MEKDVQDPDIADGSVSHGEALGARRVALSLLEAVLSHAKPLDQAIDEHKGFLSLPGRDRAFARMVVSTALRRLGQIDALIVKATERPDPPSPAALHNLLRLGVAQIAFMNVPDYAVVDTAVRLSEKDGLQRQKGLVNAVLRRVAREYRDELARMDEVRLNTPDWLMQIWIADYGLRAATEIAQANLAEAPLDISVKDPAMLQYWAGTLQASILPGGTLRRPAGGPVYDLPGFDDGMWWVQDASAALPVRLFGEVAGKHVVDLCAAPGGKTAQLAAAGAEVVALDRSMKRLGRLNENMQRLRLADRVSTEAADASVWQPPEPVYRVLLDAPCTATGTVRRHPDVLYLKKPRDLAHLVDVQARMLHNAVQMLAPGGTLIYCTCSLQKAEGEKQIEYLLGSGAAVERVPVDPQELGGLDHFVTEQGDVRILPYYLAAHGGMDGFFVSRLRRL